MAVYYTEFTDLKRIEEPLLKSEERLRLAMQGSTDAPWDWDVDSGLVHYSEPWWAMLGFPYSDGERDPVAWRTQMHPEDMPRVDAFVDALVASDDKTYSLEFRLRHHGGRYVPVLSRGFVQRDVRGKGVRIAGTNTDLTAAKEAERRIYELAYFDYLTGLPNRRLLIDELSRILPRCARTGLFGALLFIDLDNFKLLNDTLGHDAGEALLREVAARLRGTVRASDHLARLGGDEFVVVLEGLGTSEGEAILEARGLIMQLGAMVLSESCQVLARWAGDPQLREVSLAVNVSAQQLRDPRFVEQVLAILAATGAPPQQLFLDLTESVFAHNLGDACAKMNDLRAHGVCFSLDDFGTGYSSLAYLKHFPLTELKIDRSFVKDLPGEAHAGAIVDAILALARTLELDVVAEGIETGEQRDFLVARGCRLLQGFLLGMPRPIAEFEAAYRATGNHLNAP